jgi:hypothetical protein
MADGELKTIEPGKFVRYRPSTPPTERNANSQMYVTAFDPLTGLVTVTREGRPAGEIHISELLEVRGP